MLDLVHGLPGTGKTQVIKWVRRLFEEALGWTHGVQFVFLAFLNSMSAHINGLTIHHWAGIPVNAEAGKSGTKDANKMSTKCQCLRFIIIDEISMVSAELLAQVEAILRKVVRERSGYKRRSSNNSVRAFAGINIILLGDWWQLQPVRSTALYSNPSLRPSAAAGEGLDLFWKNGLGTIRKLWELTQPLRCTDIWFNSVLNKCRQGSMDLHTYCLLHGLPTLVRSSWNDSGNCPTGTALLDQHDRGSNNHCTCASDVIIVPGTNDVFCSKAWAELFLQGWSGHSIIHPATNTAPATKAECQTCAQKRQERRRVLPHGPQENDDLLKEPFASAPAIYSFNVPKYHAMHLRAREYAKTHQRQIHWAIARDVPLFNDDRSLPPDKLKTKLCKWLLNHDKKPEISPASYLW